MRTQDEKGSILMGLEQEMSADDDLCCFLTEDGE